eukprot:CAMPEP_0181291452 /NCGR_PEP_ID=MMETSP1101-20121128/1973_1 /TAXON_ID=46948 /ORGANISM="Rhodomonas abbreviata, Strain Caron Lab Isolate" /LENGTH=143 /DNA_ID=CAMNT_0023395841 /DNA_START=221 /DNA_END=649 /DNA_ORIENTATION=-
MKSDDTPRNTDLLGECRAMRTPLPLMVGAEGTSGHTEKAWKGKVDPSPRPSPQHLLAFNFILAAAPTAGTPAHPHLERHSEICYATSHVTQHETTHVTKPAAHVAGERKRVAGRPPGVPRAAPALGVAAQRVTLCRPPPERLL